MVPEIAPRNPPKLPCFPLGLNWLSVLEREPKRKVWNVSFSRSVDLVRRQSHWWGWSATKESNKFAKASGSSMVSEHSQTLCLQVIFFFFFQTHSWHVEIPRLGVQSELQLLVYATTTATQDLSHVYYLHHSLQPCWILNSLSKARDRTCVLMLVRFINHWATTETPDGDIFYQWPSCSVFPEST